MNKTLGTLGGPNSDHPNCCDVALGERLRKDIYEAVRAQPGPWNHTHPKPHPKPHPTANATPNPNSSPSPIPSPTPNPNQVLSADGFAAFEEARPPSPY